MPPRRARRPAIRSAFAIARLFLSLTCLSLSSLDGRRFYATLHTRDILTHTRPVSKNGTYNWLEGKEDLIANNFFVEFIATDQY